MAGKRLGTIFLELGIDSTEFTKGEAKILQQAQSTSLKMEQNWRTLGSHSDLIFDAMKSNINNAYNAIANNAKSTATEIIRAEQAKHDKLTALNEQQRGKQTSLLDQVKNHYIAVTVAITAAYMAASKAWTLAEAGAGYLEQMQLLDGLARHSGTTAAALTSAIRTAGDGMISMATAASSAMSGLAKHLSPDQLINLAKASVTLSDVMGVTADVAFKTLTTAMESGKEKTLKLAVGVIDLKSRYGEAAEQMTETEKRQALFNLIIEKATDIQLRMGDQVKSTSDKMETMRVVVKDLNLELGVVFLRVAAGVIGSWYSINAASMATSSAMWKVFEVTEKLTALFTFGETSKKHSELAREAAQNAASDWKMSIEYGEKAKDSFTAMTASIEELTKATGKQGAAIKEVEGLTGAELAAMKRAAQEKEQATKTITEVIRKAQIEIESATLSQYEKDIIRIESEVEKYKKSQVDEILITQFAETEKTIAKEKSRLKWIELSKLHLSDESDVLLQETLMQQNSADKTKAIWEVTYGYDNKKLTEYLARHKHAMDRRTDEIEALSDLSEGTTYRNARYFIEWEEKQERKALERCQVEAQIYQEISGYADKYYDAQKKLIDQRVKDMKRAGIDIIAIKAFEEEENYRVEQKKLLASNAYFDGVRAGYQRMQHDAETNAQIGADIWKSFENRRTQFSAQFVDSFIAGENAKVAVSKAAGDMLTGLAGDISKKMYSAAIEKIVSLIGAYIGQGAAGSGAAGAMKGGVAGALTEIGIYMGTAVVSMLAGRALAQQFKAEGGWVSSHPGGGWIQQGSGSRDDVFLGTTPGVRHWGMGGEFVVNKESSRRHAELLERINHDRGWQGGGDIASVSGPAIPWEGIAEGLGIGTGASFLHGFYKGGAFITGILEAITFLSTAIPTMFISKYAGNKFMDSGGWMDSRHGAGGMIDMGHGLGIGSFIGSIFKPILGPLGGAVSWLGSAFSQTIGSLPFVGQYIPNPFALGQLLTDPERAEKFILEIIREPFKQVAMDIATPGKYYSDALKVGITNLTSLKTLPDQYETLTGAEFPFFHNGIDFVPRTGLAMLHQGERVIPANDNTAGGQKIIVHNHFYVDGKEFKGIADKVIVDRNRSGINSQTRVYQ